MNKDSCCQDLERGQKVGEREVGLRIGGHLLNTKIRNHKALNTFSHDYTVTCRWCKYNLNLIPIRLDILFEKITRILWTNYMYEVPLRSN